MAGDDHWFVGSDGFEPVVLQCISSGCVYVLDVGVQVTLADFAACVLGLVVHTARRVSVLVDVYVLHKVVLEVLHLVLLIELSAAHCLLHFAYYHVASL